MISRMLRVSVLLFGLALRSAADLVGAASCPENTTECRTYTCEYSNDNLPSMTGAGNLNCEGDTASCQAAHCEDYHHEPGLFALAGPAEFTATIYKQLGTRSFCVCDTELEQVKDNPTPVCRKYECGNCTADDTLSCTAFLLDDGCCVQGEVQKVTWSSATRSAAAPGFLMIGFMVAISARP